MNNTNQTNLILRVIGIITVLAGFYALLNEKLFNTYFFAFFIGVSLIVIAFFNKPKGKQPGDQNKTDQ